MKIYYIIPALFIFLISSFSNSASALTISASASGSATPEIVWNDNIQNGDFFIRNNEDIPTIGDGRDEWTDWTFDFTSDPSFDSFNTDIPLTSAFLTLTLTPHSRLITTDSVRINGLSSITTVIQQLPANGTATVEIELLDYYTSDEILGKFTDEDNGYIPMFYQDDAILTYAQLDLSNAADAATPEPSTLILLGLGLGMLGYKQRKLFRKDTA